MHSLSSISFFNKHNERSSNLVEKLMRKDDAHAGVETDIANPANNPAKFADPSGEKMRALTWQGKHDVRMSSYSPNYHV